MSLKELRKNCKLTQKEAAEVVGVSHRTFVQYENDEVGADQLRLERIKEKLMEFAAKDTSILKGKVLLITGGTGSL
jgi:DNA-binding XRE family transcriptional regulator